jgi:hypothetical protein
MAADAIEKIAVGVIFGTAAKRTAALTFVITADAIMAILFVILLATGGAK